MISKETKKKYRKGIHSYLKDMGRPIVVQLKPFSVECPNCFLDEPKNSSVNKYNTDFKKPVNIFPGTLVERLIYPVPFNVDTVSGVQYDPSIPNPKILEATVCPVCIGKGRLIESKEINIQGLVTWNPKELLRELPAGLDGESICRVKTFEYNYAVVRQAESFIIDGIKCLFATLGTPRLKGLGADHIVEFYLQTVSVDSSVSEKFDDTKSIQYNPIGTVSDQAPDITPTIPPHTDGDDVW
jgi:hypothetical protein